MKQVIIPSNLDLNEEFRKPYNETLVKLLNEIDEVNIRELINLPGKIKVKQKYILVAVSKHVLETAKNKKWDLSKAWDSIYVYDGCYWQSCSKDDMRLFLSHAAIKMGIPQYEASHYEFGDKLLKQFLSDAHLPVPEANKNKVLINLKNGTAEFTNEGWQMRDFQAKDFLRYQLPFGHNPIAKCPLFDKYLLRVLPNKESQMVLQEYLGYIFTKHNLEKCLVLLGPGATENRCYLISLMHWLVLKTSSTTDWVHLAMNTIVPS